MRSSLDSYEFRQRLPGPTRAVIRAGLARYGAATSRRRPMPDFLIIGAQKAGTSALYDYLARHPQVRPAITKEVHYFDLDHDPGERWYRGHFPRQGRSAPSSFITGEATPYYLFHPLVPEKVASTLPDVKLIVLLRDPVRRAISHFYHEVALGSETRSLDRAIAEEPEIMAAEHDRLASGLPPSPAHRRCSYVSRGRYAEQLSRWLDHVDEEQLLVLPAERLSRDGGETRRRALAFLGLEDPGDIAIARVNRRMYPEPPAAVVGMLRERFVGPNRELLDLLGRERSHEFPWADDGSIARTA
jgi:hypothetical protein